MTEDQNFIDEFIQRIVIYDPLDREVLNLNGITQSIKTLKLRDMIQQSEKVDTNYLNAPFTSENHFYLNKYITNQFLAINKIVEEQVMVAQEKGD